MTTSEYFSQFLWPCRYLLLLDLYHIEDLSQVPLVFRLTLSAMYTIGLCTCHPMVAIHQF